METVKLGHKGFVDQVHVVVVIVVVNVLIGLAHIRIVMEADAFYLVQVGQVLEKEIARMLCPFAIIQACLRIVLIV